MNDKEKDAYLTSVMRKLRMPYDKTTERGRFFANIGLPLDELLELTADTITIIEHEFMSGRTPDYSSDELAHLLKQSRKMETAIVRLAKTMELGL